MNYQLKESELGRIKTTLKILSRKILKRVSQHRFTDERLDLKQPVQEEEKTLEDEEFKAVSQNQKKGREMRKQTMQAEKLGSNYGNTSSLASKLSANPSLSNLVLKSQSVPSDPGSATLIVKEQQLKANEHKKKIKGPDDPEEEKRAKKRNSSLFTLSQ